MWHTTLPAYLEERIRTPVPAASSVVPGSTPVVAFGNAREATIATLGLNPSRVEFLDHQGQELSEHHRRLETYQTLGINDLQHASRDVALRVLTGCDTYFQRNPYWQWFRPLNQVLQGLGASYTDSSACHLDLVQWATDPVWGKLAPSIRQSLIAADAAFLRQQLTQERITTVLLNGRSVIDTFAAAYGVSLTVVQQVTDRRVRADLVAGIVLGGLVVVGWSTNLQSSFGVTRVFRERLRDAVVECVAQRSGAGG